MINVSQLNANIDELEKQITNIKSAGKMFEEIQKLSIEVKCDKELHEKLINEVLSASKEMNETSDALINTLDKLNQISTEIKKAVDQNMSEIKEESKTVNMSMVEAYQKYEIDINSKLSDLNKEYLIKIAGLEETINKNNDKLSNEITMQLSNNQRATTSEIMSVNYGIQNSLMSFITSKTESMDIKFENKQKEDLVNAKILKILVGISILVSGASIIVRFIK